MSLKVGDLVECINDTPLPGDPPLPIIKGRIYTIYRKFMNGVLLEEVAPDQGFIAFWAWRFRPLQTSKLDIFRKLVAPNLEKVDA